MILVNHVSFLPSDNVRSDALNHTFTIRIAGFCIKKLII